jgi:signal transduction histidine kinase
MTYFYVKSFFRHLTLLFLCLILRGPVFGSNEPAYTQPDIKEIEGKTVIQILEVANKISFKDIKLALAFANIALEKAKLSGNMRDVLDAQRVIGFIYEDNAMTQRAIEAHTAAAKTAEILGDSARATVYCDLAIVNRKAGNYKVAYDHYERVLTIATRTNDYQMISDSYHGLGFLNEEIGIYDKAIDYYLKSKEISEKLSPKLEIARMDIIVSHNAIAGTYLKAQEIANALKHVEIAYRLAREYYKVKPDDEAVHAQLASVDNNYGQILTYQKDYVAALKKYEEALAVYQKINYKSYIGRTLTYIGDIYLVNKEYQKAAAKFAEALKYEDAFYNTDLANLYFKMGVLNIEQRKRADAETAFSRSLQLANKYDLKDIAQRANYQMFLLCLDKHDNTRALAYLNMSTALNDSLYNEKKARRTAEIELKFDVEKRENEINTLRVSQNRLVLISSIGVFALIILFLGYTIQMRGKNVRSLQAKNEEIQQQYRKMEESNEILSQFAYAAAHDLKEPLRSIGSYIGLIQMRYAKDLPPDAKEYMQFVNNGVKRMYSLLTDLLDFSQVISQQPGCEIVRPEQILSEVKDNLRGSIEAKNAQILYNQNLPSIRMNNLHMTQLFQNLIGNALKFTDKPPIVRVDAKEEDGNIILSIADNGIGIKKDYSNKVFVLFQQLNKKEQFDGTGIGLTICKNIVDKYNGKIWFESEENVGTTFFISIPSQAA